jgi:membrane protein DedA with SNARE-associated domain
MDLISWGIQFLLDVISDIGYWGIVLLMALESMCLPVPSEIVMTFGGWLAYDGRFDLTLVALAGTLGCVIGSVIAYYAGYYGGREFVIKYGRYIHLNEKSLETTERWFAKHGALAVFVTRMLPVVRTFISLPTGMAKYNFWRFVTLTAIGSFIWCYLLAYAGFILGPNWRSIEDSFRGIEVVVVLVVIAMFVYYIYHRRKCRKLKNEPKSCQEE